ncbi:porin [Oxalobacter vibrioformis]|uniref:porin n=1 Tax=Oxalobacter vibrioformis TaxID=933080 RepID=UPI0022AEF52D|nr:porin [Oxalobacter vibrioformis]
MAYGNYLYSEQLASTVRYDSPSFSGIAFSLSYSLGTDEDISALYGAGASQQYYYKSAGNDGFNVLMKYDVRPFLVFANFQRAADSNNSYLWNAGVAYWLGPAKLSIGYQDGCYKVFAVARR